MVVIVEPPVNSPESDWFYPRRRRCLKCRRYFGPLVIKRLYDTYECAGMEPPSADPADWPREHKRLSGEPKVGYLCPEDVNADRHNRDTIWLYPCGYCGMYHLGHKRDQSGTAIAQLPSDVIK